MKKSHAKGIAEIISNDEIVKMLDKAKSEIKDWTKPSCVNKGMTIGATWNILSDFNPDKIHHKVALTNIIREFGEFLPDEFQPKTNTAKANSKQLYHENPRFN